MSISRTLVRIVPAVAVGALVLSVCVGGRVTGAVASTRMVEPHRPVCRVAEPTTPAGYAALWETIPDAQWGGGDLGVSVKVAGLTVWVYADSWRPGAADGVYFVHSVGVIQDRGCVRAANGGSQLIPNQDATHIYWPNSVVALGADTIRINARLIELTGTGIWSFRDAGFEQSFDFKVTYDGLTPIGSTDLVAAPAPDPGPVYYVEGPLTGTVVPAGAPWPNHFGYSRQVHGTLPNGQTLVTIAQNWNDGLWHNTPTWKAANAPIWLAQ